MFKAGQKVRCISDEYEKVKRGDIVIASFIRSNNIYFNIKENPSFEYRVEDFEPVTDDKILEREL